MTQTVHIDEIIRTCATQAEGGQLHSLNGNDLRLGGDPLVLDSELDIETIAARQYLLNVDLALTWLRAWANDPLNRVNGTEAVRTLLASTQIPALVTDRQLGAFRRAVAKYWKMRDANTPVSETYLENVPVQGAYGLAFYSAPALASPIPELDAELGQLAEQIANNTEHALRAIAHNLEAAGIDNPIVRNLTLLAEHMGIAPEQIAPRAGLLAFARALQLAHLIATQYERELRENGGEGNESPKPGDTPMARSERRATLQRNTDTLGVALAPIEVAAGSDGDLTSACLEDGILVTAGLVDGPNDKIQVSSLEAIIGLSRKGIRKIVSARTNPRKLLNELYGDGQRLITDGAPELDDLAYLGRDLENLHALFNAKQPMLGVIFDPGGTEGLQILRSLSRFHHRPALLTDKAGDSDGIGKILETARMQGNANVIIKVDGWLHSSVIQAIQKHLNRGAEAGGNILIISESYSYLDTDALNIADLILTLKPTPLAARLRFAQIAFGNDGDLARRIAQNCATIAEIQAVQRWCDATGQDTWANIAVRLTGNAQARITMKGEGGELPVTIVAPDPNHRGFAEIVGQQSAVQQARQIIHLIANADAEQRRHAPKGILLTGKPGTGKTHLARALAQEAGMNLLLANAAEMAARPERTVAVFAEARRHAPCILFIDEIDVIGQRPDPNSPTTERQVVLNSLLTQIDGFETLDDVLVIGSTHRSATLDEALIRAGRLGLKIHMHEPNRDERELLWLHYLQDRGEKPDLDWKRLARISTGMTPADIRTASEMAYATAAIHGREPTMADLRKAIDEIETGLNDSNLQLTDTDLHRIAIHECGHALLTWITGQEIGRIQITPRHGTLGRVEILPDEKSTDSAADTLKHCLTLFGGIAAERACLGANLRGGSSDLQKIRDRITADVREMGLYSELPAGVQETDSHRISEKLLERAEALEESIARKLHFMAHRICENHSDTIRDMAGLLIEQREIEGPEAENWLNARGVDLDQERRRIDQKIGDITGGQAANGDMNEQGMAEPGTEDHGNLP